MKTWIRTGSLAGLLSLAVLSACGPKIIRLPDAQHQMVRPHELVCQSHNDCMLIEAIDGCGCSNEGYDGVANKKFRQEIVKRIQAAHKDTRCLTALNGDPRCIGAIPWCHEGKCVLVHKD